MFETKKLFVIGLAALALACNKEKVCDDNLDDNEDGLIDCEDAEQCGEDPACEVTANAATDALRGAEADIAAGNVAFEIATVNVGVEAAVLVALVSDQADTCALISDNLAVTDLKLAGFIAIDAIETDPNLAFASGTTFTGDGVTRIGAGFMQVIAGGLLSASGNSDQDSSINIAKLGADGFASANTQFDVVFDVTVAAEFDTDTDGQGECSNDALITCTVATQDADCGVGNTCVNLNDALTVAPVATAIDFTNATACPGLANAILGL